MDLEKVRNYNQKMLAVFITIIIGIAVIGFISIVIFLFSEIIPNKKPGDSALFSDRKLDQLKKDSLRQQIISYKSPELVDTASLLYVIPVNVKTLTEPEKMDNQGLGLLEVNNEIESGSSGIYSRDLLLPGSFNNLLLYDFKNNQTTMIINKRIIGVGLKYKYFDDEIILTFSGSGSDTDHDNQITSEDFRGLYIYSLKNRALNKIQQPDATVESYKFIQDEKDILITFGYDRDKNGKFDNVTEPTYVMLYNYKTGNLLNIANKRLETELQAIIDKN